MADRRLSFQNLFETTLTAEMGPTDLTAVVDSLGILTSPTLLEVEPDNDTQREFIVFDGTFGASTFVTTNIANRYLPGSAAGSNLTHPVGSKVVLRDAAQHFDDIHDRIDEHRIVQGSSGGGDPHTQYQLESGHTKALHDALGIDADTVDGQHAAAFALDSAFDAHVVLFDAHDGSRDGHPLATAALDGLMSAAYAAKLDGIEANAKDDQTITAGAGLSGGGSGNPTLSHADTSSQGSVTGGNGVVVEDVGLDEYGHVTSLGTVDLDSRFSAAAHNHSGVYLPLSGGTLTGQLVVPNGSVSAPSIRGASMENDGIYFPSEQEISFAFDGTRYVSFLDNALASETGRSAVEIKANDGVSLALERAKTVAENGSYLRIVAEDGSFLVTYNALKWLADNHN